MKPTQPVLVMFNGASEGQVNWGSKNSDPNLLLNKGDVYEVAEMEVHSWHTVIYLAEFPGQKFNDASFSYVTAKGEIWEQANAEFRKRKGL